MTEGTSGRLRFAVAPMAGNGLGDPVLESGWVATDYLEVEVAYARAPEACLGDGVVGPDEECDDASTGPGAYGCSLGCRLEACGDGVLQPTLEACDDGNTVDGDGCSATCTEEMCGDGRAATPVGELCDTSGQSASCEATCQPAACGDGILNEAAGERCDDGNPYPFDGCSPTCGALWTCNINWYDGDDGCDCGCGDWDPDCRREVLTTPMCDYAIPCGALGNEDPDDPTQCL